MDAKARLEEIRDKLLERTRAKLEIDYSGRGVLTVNDVMQILLEAGVTLPPQPAGPMKPAEAVTSEEAWGYFVAKIRASRPPSVWFSMCGPDDILALRHSIDAAMPLLARDHGLLTLAEVERRAREWVARRYAPDTEGSAWFVSLVAALTREAK